MSTLPILINTMMFGLVLTAVTVSSVSLSETRAAVNTSSGQRGPTGYTGSPGISATGPTGLPGVVGPTGFTGLPGAVGPTGLTGSPGYTGATGYTGAPGSAASAFPVSDNDFTIYADFNPTAILHVRLSAPAGNIQTLVFNDTNTAREITFPPSVSVTPLMTYLNDPQTMLSKRILSSTIGNITPINEPLASSTVFTNTAPGSVSVAAQGVNTCGTIFLDTNGIAVTATFDVTVTFSQTLPSGMPHGVIISPLISRTKLTDWSVVFDGTQFTVTITITAAIIPTPPGAFSYVVL